MFVYQSQTKMLCRIRYAAVKVALAINKKLHERVFFVPIILVSNKC